MGRGQGFSVTHVTFCARPPLPHSENARSAKHAPGTAAAPKMPGAHDYEIPCLRGLLGTIEFAGTVTTANVVVRLGAAERSAGAHVWSETSLRPYSRHPRGTGLRQLGGIRALGPDKSLALTGMGFTLYPDPPLRGLSVPAGATVFTPFAPRSARAAEFDPPYAEVMFLRVAVFGASSAPVLSIATGAGTPVEVTPDPQGVFSSPGDAGYVGDVSLKSLGGNVFDIMMGLVAADPVPGWRLGIRNTDAADRFFTWVVADDAADAVQPWVDPSPVEYAVTATIPCGTNLYHLAFDSAHQSVFLVNHDTDSVAVLDVARRVVARPAVSVGKGPVNVAVDSDGRNAYVANSEASTISVIDTDSGALTAILPGATEVRALAVDPVKRTLYAGGGVFTDHGAHMTGVVVLFDLDTHAPTATVAIAHQPYCLAVDPVTHVVYASDPEADAVSVIDPDHSSVSQIAVGKPTYGVAVDSVSGAVYLCCGEDKAVLAVDPRTRAVTTIATAEFPGGVAFDAAAHTLYFTHNGETAVSVIDIRTGAEQLVTVGLNPVAVTVDPLTHTAVTADNRAGTVSVIERRR